MREAEAIGAETDRRADRFLERLAAATATPIDDPVAVVVAHPDDEVIGAGAQLARLANLTIVHVTDGAPRNLADARAAGFATHRAYAAARRRELEAAVRLAGIPPGRLRTLGAADQGAAFALADLTRRLADLLEALDAAVVLTQPYEGGHPDHDATAFIVHAACRLLARNGAPLPALVEMASYHDGPEGRVRQRFLPDPDRAELVLRLTREQRALKQRMFDAHATQRAVLVEFTTEAERFRGAPRYDFAVLPNGGRLLYERFDWGMTGERWRALAAEALAALGLGGAPWA